MATILVHSGRFDVHHFISPFTLENTELYYPNIEKKEI